MNIEELKKKHLRRIIGIIRNPVQTFKSFPLYIKIDDWLVPLLVILLISFISLVITEPLANEWQINRLYETLENNPDMPDESQALIYNQIDSVSENPSFIGFAISGIILWFLFLSGVIMFVGKVMMDVSLEIKTVWLLVIITNIIYALGILAKIPLILISGDFIVETSFSILIPDRYSSSMIYYLLRSFDFFSIWRVIITGIGMSILFNLDRRMVLNILFGGWFLFALISAVIISRSGYSMLL